MTTQTNDKTKFKVKTLSGYTASLSYSGKFVLFFACKTSNEQQVALENALAEQCKEFGIEEVYFRKDGAGFLLAAENEVEAFSVAEKIALVMSEEKIESAKGEEYFCGLGVCGGEQNALSPYAQQPQPLIKTLLRCLVYALIGCGGYLLFECLANPTWDAYVILMILAYTCVGAGAFLSMLAYAQTADEGLAENNFDKYLIPVCCALGAFILTEIVLFPVAALCWGLGGTDLMLIFELLFSGTLGVDLCFAVVFIAVGVAVFTLWSHFSRNSLAQLDKRYAAAQNRLKKRAEKAERKQRDSD